MRAKFTYFGLFFIALFFSVYAQNNNYSFERGVPQLCENCGGCPSGTLSICICFDKLVFQNADIRAIFALLSDTGNVNIVVDPELSIKVSLKLENVSWCQVFSLLLDLYNLRAVQKEGYLYVLSNDKYWSLKFGTIENQTREKQLKSTETRTYRLTNIMASDIQGIINNLLSSKGHVSVDNATNSLIVTDIPDQFSTIEAVIDSLNVSTMQVKVVIRMLQIEKSALKELGLDLSITRTDDKLKGSSNMDLVSSVPRGEITWDIISGNFDFDVKLSAAISEGKSRILDEKTCVVLNHQKCILFSGKQIPINMLDPSGNTVTTFYQVGNKLEVTPNIVCDSRTMTCEGITETGDVVNMDIHFERSGYNPAATSPGGYDITTRSLDTKVIVSSGDILAIGSVITNEFQYSESGVPILKDIPLLGELFKYRNRSVKNTVITIIVTPEILAP